MTSQLLDLTLQLRLAVSRFGEGDGARWWKTGGVLSNKGRYVYGRSYPKTAPFAQTRVVFAAARGTCENVAALPPGSTTLWRLPAQDEDAITDRWSHWVSNVDAWNGFFDALQPPPGGDLLAYLTRLGLEPTVDAVPQAQPAHNVVPVEWEGSVDERTLWLLASGFSAGSHEDLVVPYLASKG